MLYKAISPMGNHTLVRDKNVDFRSGIRMFQQEILMLLEEFKVHQTNDFYKLPPGKRTYFISRLYKAFDKNRQEAFQDLSIAGGVNFHFETSGDLTNQETNLPTNAFLKKLCFYSNRMLVTFPFKEVRKPEETRLLKGVHKKAWTKSKFKQSRPIIFGPISSKRTPIGGMLYAHGKTYTLDNQAFCDFLESITLLRPAVDAGLAYFLPSFPDDKVQMRRLNRHLTSANFSLSELDRQFNESELYDSDQIHFDGDLLNLYLPYFKDVPIERILEIRDKQQDMYNEFQRYLENLIGGIEKDEAEEKLLLFLRDVDTGIRELNRSFTSAQKEYFRKDIVLGLGILSTGLALYASAEWGQELAKYVAGATGGATGMKLLSGIADKSTAFSKHSDDRFYLPWLVHKAKPTLIEQP